MSLEKSMNQWAQVSIQAQTRNFRLDSWGFVASKTKMQWKAEKNGLGFRGYHLLESCPCPAPKTCPT